MGYQKLKPDCASVLRCTKSHRLAAGRVTVPMSWHCVIRTAFWFYALNLSGCFFGQGGSCIGPGKKKKEKEVFAIAEWSERVEIFLCHACVSHLRWLQSNHTLLQVHGSAIRRCQPYGQQTENYITLLPWPPCPIAGPFIPLYRWPVTEKTLTSLRRKQRKTDWKGSLPRCNTRPLLWLIKRLRPLALLQLLLTRKKNATDIIWVYSTNRLTWRGCVTAVCKALKDLHGCCV